jgi:hypothetical protein
MFGPADYVQLTCIDLNYVQLTLQTMKGFVAWSRWSIPQPGMHMDDNLQGPQTAAICCANDVLVKAAFCVVNRTPQHDTRLIYLKRHIIKKNSYTQ